MDKIIPNVSEAVSEKQMAYAERRAASFAERANAYILDTQSRVERLARKGRPAYGFEPNIITDILSTIIARYNAPHSAKIWLDCLDDDSVSRRINTLIAAEVAKRGLVAAPNAPGLSDGEYDLSRSTESTARQIENAMTWINRQGFTW